MRHPRQNKQSKKDRRRDTTPSKAPSGKSTSPGRGNQQLSEKQSLLRPLIFAAVLVLGGLAIYSSALPGAFILDDLDLRESYSTLRSGQLGLVGRVMQLIITGRPLLWATYQLNHTISGFDPYGFHLTNILLHIINALLVWGLASTIRRNGYLEHLVPERLQTIWVYAIPLLFLASPIQTESVAYISSRSESLSTVFVLGSLWAFLSQTPEKHPWLNALFIAFLFGCAVLTKQDKPALIAVLPLADYLLLSKLDWRRLGRNWRVYSLFLIGTVIGYFLVIEPHLNARSAGFGLPWQPYLFTQFRMYFMYMRLMALPFGLNADYDIAASETLWDHFSWLGLIVLLAIAAATIYFHRRTPLICFGIAFFFIMLAPTSSFLPIADFANERRLYLPMLGILLAACTAIFRYVRPDPRKAWAGLVVVLAVYSVGTYQRSAVWSNPISLWLDTVEKSPEKARPWIWLGKVYNDTNLHTQAINAWVEGAKHVKKRSGEHAHLLNNLGLAFANLGDRERAIEYYNQALDMRPGASQFRANLAIAQLRLGREEEGWKSFERAAHFARRRPGVFRLRGQEYYQRGRYQEAIADFERVLRFTPEDPVLIHNLEAAREMHRRSTQGSKGNILQ